MAPKRSQSKKQGPGAVSFARPQPSLLDFSFVQTKEASDEDLSSLNGFESPHHMRAKVDAGKPLVSQTMELLAVHLCDRDAYTGRKVRAAQDELEDMAGWDYDAGSARLVGVSQQSGGVHQGNFVSPYWGAACRRALVEGLVRTHEPKVPEEPVEEKSNGDELASFYEDFDYAVGRVMNVMPKDHPNLKDCLRKAMDILLISDAARAAFVCWYNDFQDSFAGVWDDPDVYATAEEILACIVEDLKPPPAVQAPVPSWRPGQWSL